jgi:hypothetical protein
VAPLDLFVVRRPPDTAHFISQRIRQAYDEWARPARFASELALLPAIVLLGWQGPGWPLAAAACGVAAAEIGRRRGMGRTVFPRFSALWAPAWFAERAVTSWMALGTRVFFGGVRYRTGRLKQAATPRRMLEDSLRRRWTAGVASLPDGRADKGRSLSENPDHGHSTLAR